MTSSFPLSPPLDHAWIAAHIPHSGSMCLLDQVVDVALHLGCGVTRHDLLHPAWVEIHAESDATAMLR